MLTIEEMHYLVRPLTTSGCCGLTKTQAQDNLAMIKKIKTWDELERFVLTQKSTAL